MIFVHVAEEWPQLGHIMILRTIFTGRVSRDESAANGIGKFFKTFFGGLLISNF